MMRRRAFTLAELLVVIGLIVLLIAILLPALAAVQRQAKVTTTTATMNDFGQACDKFALDHGFYPGVIPEDVLASNPNISGTENALLHLMGGYRVLAPADVGTPVEDEYNAYPGVEITFTGPNGEQYALKFNADEFGNGPVIGGKQYPAYFTPGSGQIIAVQGQENELDDQLIPDLVDAWGQPIIYVRRIRKIGPIVGEIDANPRFLWQTMEPYLLSNNLGGLAADQQSSVFRQGGTPPDNSTLSMKEWNLMAVIANQAFRNDSTGDVWYTAARGSIALISSGPDGIYFSREDGAGSGADPRDDIPGPAVISEYDDIVVVGGGSG